jgi:DNA polymerase-1
MHVLIDGDILCYTTAAAVEKPVDWGNDLWTLHSDFKEAKQRVDVDIVEFVETLGGTKFTVCLSDSENFRKQLYPEYKSNRVGVRKPVVFSALRDYLIDNWDCQFWPRLEADDVMGILATGKDECVIVSADKDLRTVPTKVYNPSKPDLGVIDVSETEADRNHLIQTLTGDRTDGYPGCPGIGPARAEKIVDGGWDAVVDAYAKAGLNEATALTQARLARILRKGDYVRKTGLVKLWAPAKKAVAA